MFVYQNLHQFNRVISFLILSARFNCYSYSWEDVACKPRGQKWRASSETNFLQVGHWNIGEPSIVLPTEKLLYSGVLKEGPRFGEFYSCC